MTQTANTHPALNTGSIQNLELANRYVLAPMSRASATEDGVPTAEMAEYYARFAKGGFGLLIAEGAYPDTTFSQAYSNQPGLCTDAQQEGWRQVVEAVHAQGSKIVLQLIHAGAVSQVVDVPHGPSPIRPEGHMLQMYGTKQGPYEEPAELCEKDIAALKAGFVQAAKRAEKAGFDGVEIHCANGYLLDQFLTPETNLRNAPYGGSVENRIRLTCEIIAEVRAICRQDFVTGVRLSQAKATQPDYFWMGGLDDARVIFSAVAEAGASFIHFASERNGYFYHSSTKDGVRLTKLAREITGLPVIANGGLEDFSLSAQILSEGEADFLAIGKSAMCNPDLPNRIANQQLLKDFTFEVFSYGIQVSGQLKWEAEQSA
ncbi:NADH:flavin oxidoreductase [Epibacterium sp. SM1979]|uniref:NADH:flavin oxidoreductase n=1 Tax=Tritonibacter litoralis TaxID=2662264 RepID=A0A843YF71_9RHOB|nr:NADH:flavin oxidoreductase [Tritonibacter litoralis]MQQ07739.1 NADH:flavin oxidoreductase [Tritonibacter litoralis]